MTPMTINPDYKVLRDKTQLLLEISAGLHAAVRDDNYDRASHFVHAVRQLSKDLPDLITTLKEQNND